MMNVILIEQRKVLAIGFCMVIRKVKTVKGGLGL